MIFDAQNLFCDAMTLITTFGTTLLSTNTIDLGAQGTDTLGNALPFDLGRSRTSLLVQIVTAVTSAGAATVKAEIITSASANLGTPTVISSTAAIAKATLVAGYKFRLAIPPGLAQRYLGLQFTIGTADTTAGAVTAGLVGNVETVFVG